MKWEADDVGETEKREFQANLLSRVLSAHAPHKALELLDEKPKEEIEFDEDFEAMELGDDEEGWSADEISEMHDIFAQFDLKGYAIEDIDGS